MDASATTGKMEEQLPEMWETLEAQRGHKLAEKESTEPAVSQEQLSKRQVSLEDAFKMWSHKTGKKYGRAELLKVDNEEPRNTVTTGMGMMGL